MPKAKPKKNSRKARFTTLHAIFISKFVLLGFLLLFLMLFVYKPSFPTHKANKVQTTVLASQEPVATLSATPTEIPLSGYCLHVPVLMYHHVQPWSEAEAKGQTALTVDSGTFENHMAYLSSQGYSTITLKALVDALRNHTALPAKSVALTFDDGYKDNYTYAFPIIKKYGVTANLLVSTGLVEGVDYLTWSQLSEMKNSGNFYFVNHTWSHASLGNAAQDKIHAEVETAQKQMQEHLGVQAEVFGYPYGSFSADVIAILQANGFFGAFSTLPGTMQCDSFIMTLHRTRIGNGSLSAYGL